MSSRKSTSGGPAPAPKRTGSMTPRTASTITAPANSSAVTTASGRPSSALKKSEAPQTKLGPSPPTSSHVAARPGGSAGRTAAIPKSAPLMQSIPEFVNFFQTLLQSTTAATVADITRLWSIPEDPAATLRAALGSSVASGDKTPLISGAISVSFHDGAASNLERCTVDVEMGQRVIATIATEADGLADRTILQPLTAVAGTRGAMNVEWSTDNAGSVHWQLNSSDIQEIRGRLGDVLSGAGIQRGGITIAAEGFGPSKAPMDRRLSVAIPHAVISSTNKSTAVAACTVCVPMSSQNMTSTPAPTVSETFTHAADESVSTISRRLVPAGDSKGQTGLDATIDVMDGIATYQGQLDVVSQRMEGDRVKWTVRGSNSTARATYEGPMRDSLRHGAQGAWRVAVGGDGSGASSVEYTGPWHNDARHGSSGRLTVRLGAAASSGGESSTPSPPAAASSGIHIDGGWDYGEADGTMSLTPIGDTTPVVKCDFVSGSLGPKCTLYFSTGSFVGAWTRPQDVTPVIPQLVNFLESTSVRMTCRVPPLSLLQSNTASLHAGLQKPIDAVGAMECVRQRVVAPLWSDQVEGPVAELMAARIVSLTSRHATALSISNHQAAAKERDAKGATEGLKRAKQQLQSTQSKLAEVGERLAKLRGECETLSSSVQHQSSLLASESHTLESLGSASCGDSDEKASLSSKLKALQSQKSSIEGEIAELTQEWNQLKADVKKVQARKDQMQKEIRQMEGDTQANLEKSATLDGQIDAQLAKAVQHETESSQYLEKSEAQRSALSREVADAQQRLSSSDQDGDSHAENSTGGLREQLSTLREAVVALKSRIEDGEAQRLRAEREWSSLVAESSSELTVDEMQQETARLTAGLDAARSSLEAKQLALSQMATLLQQKRESVAALVCEAGGHKRDEGEEPLGDASHRELMAALQSKWDHQNQSTVVTRTAMTKKMMSLDTAKEVVVGLERRLADLKALPPPMPTVTAARVPTPVVTAPVDAEEPKPDRPPQRTSPVPRVATPPPDPRIAVLETSVKEALAKQEHWRRKRDILRERLEQLESQRDILDKTLQRKTQEAAEASKASSVGGPPQEVGNSFDGTIPELKALLAKMKDQNKQYEGEIESLKMKADAASAVVEDLNRQLAASQLQPQTSSVAGDWRTRALQDEVDARESRINALRSELKRVHLLEAKIQSAKETMSTLAQSAEIRQTQAAQMARADSEWSSNINMRKASTAGRSAFF